MDILSGIFESLFWFIGWFILIYMLAVILFYTSMLVVSFFQLRKEVNFNKTVENEEFLDAKFTKPVSIIVPAYNEEAGLIESVRSLLSLNYPQTELIVVNDGSTDQTVPMVIEHFQMIEVPKAMREQLETAPVRAVYQSMIIPHLFMVDKENGGKADALNAGINMSRYPYFCSIDGDSILEKNSLLKVMKPIIKSGEEVIASGGNVRIANGCSIHMGNVTSVSLSKNPLIIMQIIEYLRAFLIGRVGLSRYNMLLIISGAFSVFSKEWVIEAGGYDTKTVGEDMELVVRLHRMLREKKANKRIEFVPDPVCWTEAPEKMKYLQMQRSRWHRGLLDSVWKHKKMTFNPKYGSVGMFSFPYYWIVELFGPIVEFFGYVFIIISLFLGTVYVEFALLLLLAMVLYGSVLSMVAVLLDVWSVNKYPKISDIVLLFIHSIFEAFWYRPLTVFWRCAGVMQWLTKYSKWDIQERKGLSKI